MRIFYETDYQAMSRRAAAVICANVLLKPACVLGLATGSTPIGAYGQLIQWRREGGISFCQTRSVNLDEYKGIAPDHDQSYRYFMQKNLFDHIDILPENTYVPNGLAADSADECARYEEIIQKLGGIDLQLLGIGHNGHIGFNEPAEDFAVGTHVVDLTQSTIAANARFFKSDAEVPRQAFTTGIRSIMQAKQILVVVSGKEKADIVKRSFRGPVTPQVPASILQLHPDVILVGDEAALCELNR